MRFTWKSRRLTPEAALRDIRPTNPRQARFTAAHALGDVEPANLLAALEALISVLDDERDAQVRAECCASLGALAQYGTAPADPASARRREAASEPRRVDAAVAAATVSSELRLRLVNALVRRMSDGDKHVRQHAVIALGAWRDVAALEPLREALRDGPADVRFQAVTSLCEIAPELAMAPLRAALQDSDAQVVSAAALGLGAIGDGQVVRDLAVLLTHAVAAVQFDAAYALAQLGDGRGREVLHGALADRERVWDAVTALEGLATSADIAALGAVAAAIRTHPLESRVLAAGALLRLATVAVDASAQEAAQGHRAAAQAALSEAFGRRDERLLGVALAQLPAPLTLWARGALAELRRHRRARAHLDEIDRLLAA